jgi:hypothetical protein
MRQLVNRDVLLDGLDVSPDLLQRPRRRVLVEVANVREPHLPDRLVLL